MLAGRKHPWVPKVVQSADRLYIHLNEKQGPKPLLLLLLRSPQLLLRNADRSACKADFVGRHWRHHKRRNIGCCNRRSSPWRTAARYGPHHLAGWERRFVLQVVPHRIHGLIEVRMQWHPTICLIRWCRRHKAWRFSALVMPAGQGRTWSRSVNRTFNVHPGNRHRPSRAFTNPVSAFPGT